MTTAAEPQSTLASFIQRWQASSAAERANYQLFLSEICDQLQVPRPDPSIVDDAKNLYVFEKAITFRHGHRVEELLQTLVCLGQARPLPDRKYTA